MELEIDEEEDEEKEEFVDFVFLGNENYARLSSCP